MSRDAGRLPRWKLLVFSCAPALVLLGVAELVAQVAIEMEPSIETLPLAPDAPALFVPHEERFWALRPDAEIQASGVTVRTNSHGLRGPEIRERVPSELRVLSIGESTTFGDGVEGEETYTALLAERLQASRPEGAGRVTAINAGVPAYSSFQGLRFLESEGLALGPDLLLVYFELNDHLPSSLREGDDEIGLARTDAELDAWRASRAGRRLASVSALYRVLTLWSARRAVRSFDAAGFQNPLLEIGMPDIGLQPRLDTEDATLDLRPGGREVFLSRRVSDEERRRHFEAFIRLAEEHGIGLVLIHPSYRYTRPHRCLLTELARELEQPLFEAHLALHPQGVAPGALFRDFWHPNPRGHARLARALHAHLVEWGLVRADD